MPLQLTRIVGTNPAFQDVQIATSRTRTRSSSIETQKEAKYLSIQYLCYKKSMERPFDHEKLDVYQIELQFIGWLADFFVEISKSRAARCRELFDQLDRASLSALLNTAEGNGKRQGRQRAKFFEQIQLLLFDAVFHVTPNAIKLLVQDPCLESGRLNRIAPAILGQAGHNKARIIAFG